jgi:rhomboid family GlyGly-CTERM serine protease
LRRDGGLSRAELAWVALAALLGAMSILVGFFATAQVTAALDWQPVQAMRQPWRWWSAAFVHLSRWHLAANLAGCAVVAAFGAAAHVSSRAPWAWCIAWPLTHLGLAVQPALTSYGGLSGVLHAGVAITALELVLHDRGLRRGIGMAVVAGLVLKLALERPWGTVTVQSAAWDFPVAPLAHATGALAGLACGGVAACWRRGAGVAAR